MFLNLMYKKEGLRQGERVEMIKKWDNKKVFYENREKFKIFLMIIFR